jgi:hypothetical protein
MIGAGMAQTRPGALFTVASIATGTTTLYALGIGFIRRPSRTQTGKRRHCGQSRSPSALKPKNCDA